MEEIIRVPIKLPKSQRRKPTVKKIKVTSEGYRINPETGEQEPCVIMDVKDLDFNFKKFFVSQWLATAEIFGKRGKLAFWIMDNIDANNRLCYTQDEIAHETSISLKTVQTTMSLLQQYGFLLKERNGCYRINPNFIFKGSHQQRMNIWIQYSQLQKDKDHTVWEQVEN